MVNTKCVYLAPPSSVFIVSAVQVLVLPPVILVVFTSILDCKRYKRSVGRKSIQSWQHRVFYEREKFAFMRVARLAAKMVHENARYFTHIM